MTARKGSMVLIKIGNGATTEVFTTIGGLRTSELVINNRPMEANTLETGIFRTMLGSSGLSSLRIIGTGIFNDTTSEDTLRGYAMNGSKNNYQFIFANGSYCTGPFIVARYERSADFDAEELYAIALESAGEISYFSA